MQYCLMPENHPGILPPPLALSRALVLGIAVCQGLPIWWCPWIHDLGLMAGCVMHGFMNINAMRSNVLLPLNPTAILEHISRTFLNNGRAPGEPSSRADGASAAENPSGSGQPPGLGVLKPLKGFSPGDDAAQAWAEEASVEFPSRRSAEDRVFRICVAMTKLLPPHNPVRIRVYNERWG